MRALIVGGGIGGLSAAVALRRHGIQPVVLERRADGSAMEAGTGLTIWSNAVNALRAVGLGDAVITAGSPTEWFEQLSTGGKVLSRWPLKAVSDAAGAPTVGVTRQALTRVLRDAAGDAVKVGAECVRVEEDGDVVTATLADGTQERGDVLIGADGLRSTVRSHLFGADRPRFAGYVAWRGITSNRDDVPARTFRLLWGRGLRFGSYPVSPTQLYWFAVSNAAEREPDGSQGRKHDVTTRFAGWPDATTAILESTAEADIQRTDIHDRDPIARWGKGRMTLLGDAAHPMTFNVGQGACQAIEDAVSVAEHLAGGGPPADALRRYEDDRSARTAAMVKRARLLGNLGRWQNPAACWARDQALALALDRVGLRRLRHEVGHDVVAAAQRVMGAARPDARSRG